MPLDRTHAFANQRLGGKRSMVLYPLWRIMSLISRRADAYCRICESWFQFSRNAVVEESVRLGPHAWCINETHDSARIALETGTMCRGLLRLESFGRGKIRVHDHVYIGDDVLISSACEVEIGANTLIAHGVQIFDNDAHPLDQDARVTQWRRAAKEGHVSGEAAPVLVGRGVWICTNAIILKGVSVGDGSVVAAGSVVTSSVPPGVLVGGNPAIVLRGLCS